jgi:uncharacterized protein YecE (DUF72 family)
MRGPIYVGCAGWSVRKEHADLFAGQGTHLERYASRFGCVEINSSFYRPHRRTTYERWAASTPSEFRFAVKFPRQVTHESRLRSAQAAIEQFAAEVAGLGEKLGGVLVQLPPSLRYEPAIADEFFSSLRARITCPVVCEPRHVSWFTADAEALLQRHRIARVAANPSIVPDAAVPGGHQECVYFRWHGTPRMYYSAYDETALAKLAQQAVAAGGAAKTVWCIFDNTAAGAAVENAVALQELLKNPRR